MSSTFQRMTAWLCLLLAVLTAIAPAQGFVLCVEPDGCVTIEVANAEDSCGACCAVPSEGPRQPAANVLAADDACCPCLDLLVPGTTEDLAVQPRQFEIPLVSWTSSTGASAAQFTPAIGLAARAPRIEPPRPPDSLALISSVVLLV